METTSLFIIGIIAALVLVASAGSHQSAPEQVVIIVPASTPPQTGFGCLGIILVVVFVSLVLGLLTHTP